MIGIAKGLSTETSTRSVFGIRTAVAFGVRSHLPAGVSGLAAIVCVEAPFVMRIDAHLEACVVHDAVAFSPASRVGRALLNPPAARRLTSLQGRWVAR